MDHDESATSDASLVAGWAEPGGGRIAALRVDLAPGWKTYWRQPGEAGIPPTFDWSGSENLGDIRIAWPAPVVFHTYGMRTIGYHDRMVLPLKVTPRDPALPVRLSLSLFYGVCEEICVPARADLALTIAPGAPAEAEALIRDALAALPAPAETAGLTAARCVLEGA
ncbi:MAG: protein-disulfide reductase DsbD domain-containing protein, partial [Paracoccaceae bacterium]